MSTRRQLVLDGALAVAAFALTLLVLGLGGVHLLAPDERGLDALGVALAAAASLPLLARRRAPAAVFVLTALASTALAALHYAAGPPVGPTLALYFAAQHGRRPWRTAILAAALLGGHLAAFGLARDELPDAEALFGLLLWGGAWLAGDRTRLRRQRIAELEERAVRAEREAERERRLAAAEERTRIARELHDSAGHAINVILVQAGAARLLQERDPAAARAALETVEDVARDTIDEIDKLVRALRDDEPDRAIEPPPGLAALGTLVARHRDAGLPVELGVRGEQCPLPAGVDRAAYRILQEALTNAARHGCGGAEVDLAFVPGALAITVVNPVAAGENGRPAGGHGLVGMRERAALLGGSLETEAGGGRFVLRARLPLPTA